MKKHSVLYVLAIFVTLVSCGKKNQVVVYTAHDQIFSEPVLKAFEEETGIKVLAKYDTEYTKTTGLVSAIKSESKNPRCDLFWNNEIVQTIQLKNGGYLRAYESPQKNNYPEAFVDKDHYWYGFASRARVIIVNTDLVREDEMPNSIFDLTKKRWKSKVSIAKPFFGTTATQAACLFSYLGEEKAKEFYNSLKENDVKIEGGNKNVAVNVAKGLSEVGLTDTDDAIIELEKGSPVKIIFPDRGADQMGVLFIPNTVCLIKDSPQQKNAEVLLDYLISEKIERKLALSTSSQIPMHKNLSELKIKIGQVKDYKAMEVDFNKSASKLESSMKFLSIDYRD